MNEEHKREAVALRGKYNSVTQITQHTRTCCVVTARELQESLLVPRVAFIAVADAERYAAFVAKLQPVYNKNIVGLILLRGRHTTGGGTWFGDK